MTLTQLFFILYGSGGHSNKKLFGPEHRARVSPPFKFKNRALLPASFAPGGCKESGRLIEGKPVIGCRG